MKIVIEGVPPYDGEYELDISYFTSRELHVIKKVSGVRAGELEEAVAAGDNDVFVAVAGIAIQRRTGKEPEWDALWDAPAGKIGVIDDEEEQIVELEDDAIPPELAPRGSLDEPPTGDAALSSSNEISGSGSGSSSEPQVSVLRPTGTQP